LVFALLDGWAYDLEPMAPVAGQGKAEGARSAMYGLGQKCLPCCVNLKVQTTVLLTSLLEIPFWRLLLQAWPHFIKGVRLFCLLGITFYKQLFINQFKTFL
jgi:hypothetical protein